MLGEDLLRCPSVDDGIDLNFWTERAVRWIINILS